MTPSSLFCTTGRMGKMGGSRFWVEGDPCSFWHQLSLLSIQYPSRDPLDRWICESRVRGRHLSLKCKLGSQNHINKL